MPELDKLSFEFDELRMVFLAFEVSLEPEIPDDLTLPRPPQRVQVPVPQTI